MTGTPRIGPGFITGPLIAGYGLLILLGVSAHESLIVGAGLLTAGVALAAVSTRAPHRKRALWGRAAQARDDATDGSHPRPRPPPRPIQAGGAPDDVADSTDSVHWAWRVGVALLGTVSAGGVIVYNALAKSNLELPELAILAYGAFLHFAAPRLEQRIRGVAVGTIVAWSLPIVAAPLGMYAFDALLDAEFGSSPLDVWIAWFLVKPLAWSLDLLGFSLRAMGQTIIMETPRGRLALSVGLVCAGIHPGILFMGVLGLHAWEERPSARRVAILFIAGLVGVYVANLIRLVLLALVGYTWGGATLQSAHANAGWVIFIAFMAAYWWIAMRDCSPAARP